ncbi:MAG: hypothetical protein IKJ01_02800 [Lachnospiraceae bacterium]|nr:hypothetical protein [Lachnospiraceae bacterium]
MGIIGNLLIERIVKGQNHRNNHINRKSIDIISTNTNLILCGGRAGTYNRRREYVLSLAEQLKLQTFLKAIEQAERTQKGSVCFFATDYFPIPDMKQLRLQSEHVYFGQNATYNPLNTGDMSLDASYEFFKRIVTAYCHRKMEDTHISTICGTIRMLLSIISENMGDTYITLENLSALAEALTNNQLQFQNEVLSLTGKTFLKRWENYLTLSWDDSSRKFFEFWQDFMQSIGYYKKAGITKEESLYTVLSSRKICLCGLSTSQELLRDIMLSELEMVHERIIRYYKYKLINYYVPLKNSENLRCITNSECCMIGDSLTSMELLPMRIKNPTFICLGVNSKDATDIFEIMVYAGTWTRTNFGFLPFGSNIAFNDSERKPITEDRLSLQQIPDGSAFKIDEKGYTYIYSLF